MDIQKINQYKSAFDAIAKSINDGENSVEVWYARELQVVLDYKEWRKFENVIKKASGMVDKAYKTLKTSYSIASAYADFLTVSSVNPVSSVKTPCTEIEISSIFPSL